MVIELTNSNRNKDSILQKMAEATRVQRLKMKSLEDKTNQQHTQINQQKITIRQQQEQIERLEAATMTTKYRI